MSMAKVYGLGLRKELFIFFLEPKRSFCPATQSLDAVIALTQSPPCPKDIFPFLTNGAKGYTLLIKKTVEAEIKAKDARKESPTW